MTAEKPPAVPFYEGKGVTLYCATFEQILPELPTESIQSLITDPPYGNTALAWDKMVDWPLFWREAIRLCGPKSPMVLFASGKFVNQLINSNVRYYRYELVWEKNLAVGHLDANQRPLRSHEMILIFSTLFRGSTYNPQMVPGKVHTIGNSRKVAHYGKSSGNVTPSKTGLYHPKSVLRFNNTRVGRSLHPTQKPLDLMQWLVRTYSNRGDLILDPFAGSGSTLAAAALNGRRAIGVEQNPDYCAIIAERLEKGV